MKIKSWHDLTASQKGMVVIAGVIQVSLLGAALYDLRRRPADQIRGSKKLWMGLVFINYLGPIAYFLYGRKSGETCEGEDVL